MWQGRATSGDRVGRAEGVLMPLGKGQAGLSQFSHPPFLSSRVGGGGQGGKELWAGNRGLGSGPVLPHCLEVPLPQGSR